MLPFSRILFLKDMFSHILRSTIGEAGYLAKAVVVRPHILFMAYLFWGVTPPVSSWPLGGFLRALLFGVLYKCNSIFS